MSKDDIRVFTRVCDCGSGADISFEDIERAGVTSTIVTIDGPLKLEDDGSYRCLVCDPEEV